MLCEVSPPQYKYLNTFCCAVPPWFWVVCGVMCGVHPWFWIVCSVLELYPVSQLQFWNLTWYPQVEYQSSSTCIIECGTPSLAYPLFIIWWNINFDIGKTIRRCHFKTWHFVHFWIKHLSTNEPHRALIYTHEWPWALVCTETLKSLMPESHQWSWALISAHCGSWVLKCLIQK